MLLTHIFQALVLFSRVLFNVAKGLGIGPPKTTHILFSLDFKVSTLDAGIIDLSSDVTMHHSQSTSTSLPDERVLKAETAKQRIEALLRVIPNFDVEAFKTHKNGIGYCAEFPNALG